jgi:hypothetical protein
MALPTGILGFNEDTDLEDNLYFFSQFFYLSAPNFVMSCPRYKICRMWLCLIARWHFWVDLPPLSQLNLKSRLYNLKLTSFTALKPDFFAKKTSCREVLFSTLITSKMGCWLYIFFSWARFSGVTISEFMSSFKKSWIVGNRFKRTSKEGLEAIKALVCSGFFKYLFYFSLFNNFSLVHH